MNGREPNMNSPPLEHNCACPPELSIGTSAGRDDVFPRTVVGRKGAKKIAIVHGYVHRDEAPAKISVGDYTKRNYSSSDRPDPSANLFRMEPGRCVTQTLYGVSRAHVATPFHVMPVCVKRMTRFGLSVLFIDVSEAYSPVNRAGSPQGFFTESPSTSCGTEVDFDCELNQWWV